MHTSVHKSSEMHQHSELTHILPIVHETDQRSRFIWMCTDQQPTAMGMTGNTLLGTHDMLFDLIRGFWRQPWAVAELSARLCWHNFWPGQWEVFPACRYIYVHNVRHCVTCLSPPLHKITLKICASEKMNTPHHTTSKCKDMGLVIIVGRNKCTLSSSSIHDSVRKDCMMHPKDWYYMFTADDFLDSWHLDSCPMVLGPIPIHLQANELLPRHVG